MITGWQFILNRFNNQKAWFFFDKTSGAMKKGWLFDNNSWYWLDKTSGEMATGWLKANEKIYYLEPRSGYNQGHAYQKTTATI